MTLAFPNPSRSYDSVQKRVRFVGHDGMAEIPFQVDADALSKHRPDPGAGEASSLAAFDADRSAIYDVAREAYSHGRKRVYVLTSADFR